MNEWNVAIVEIDMLRRHVGVALYRQAGDHTEMLCSDGMRRLKDREVDADVDWLFRIPVSALAPLRDAIDERVGRRVDEKQLEEVRSTLAVERGRLDKVLDAFLRTER